MMPEKKSRTEITQPADEKKERMRTRSERSNRLASTAGWIAAVRAHEQERTDRLFSDPWAAKLAGEKGWLWRERTTGGKDENEVGLVIRTRYFDDFLLQVTQEHQVRQVVILGAGMDTRAFRHHWPGHVHLFELDQPQLFDLKEPLLTACGAGPTCQRHIVPIDLRDEWFTPLLRAGFDRGKPSAWLMEGLLFYLPQESVIQLFEVVTTASAVGSWLGCEVKNTEMLTGASTRAWIETLEQEGAPWVSSIDHPEAFLAKYGWRASVVQLGDKEAHFGRWPFPVLPRSVLGVPRTFFVTATRNSS
jgi:methyltransferase (TIGR00027 family)